MYPRQGDSVWYSSSRDRITPFFPESGSGGRAALAKAHAALDTAVDRCYRPKPFENDRSRVEHLFALYEKLTAPLAPGAKKKSIGGPFAICITLVKQYYGNLPADYQGHRDDIHGMLVDSWDAGYVLSMSIGHIGCVSHGLGGGDSLLPVSTALGSFLPEAKRVFPPGENPVLCPESSFPPGESSVLCPESSVPSAGSSVLCPESPFPPGESSVLPGGGSFLFRMNMASAPENPFGAG